jgi:hypothetical protein
MQSENQSETGRLLYARVELERSNKKPFMVRWLLKLGIKTEPQAVAILLCLSILCFLLSIYFFFFLNAR